MSMMFMTSFSGYLILMMFCILSSLSVESLLIQWVCLEINMLSVIPLLVGSPSSGSILMGVKYFISQSAASLIFIISLLLNYKFMSMNLAITMSMLFKMGLPPFHSWIISIIPTLGLMEMFILFTIQKVIPLIILSQLNKELLLLILTVLMTLYLIFVMVVSVSSLNNLMFLSSMSNGVWMVSGLSSSGQWMIYLIGYSFMLASVLISLKLMKMFKMSLLLNFNSVFSSVVAMQFFNLGGVPPLLGFMLKLMMIKEIMILSSFLMLLLLFVSLSLLYCYTKMFYHLYSINVMSSVIALSQIKLRLLVLTLFMLGGMMVMTWLMCL